MWCFPHIVPRSDNERSFSLQRSLCSALHLAARLAQLYLTARTVMKQTDNTVLRDPVLNVINVVVSRCLPVHVDLSGAFYVNIFLLNLV